MQSNEIGNLSQYLAMKEFHGHNISDEMLEVFIRAQNVIDQTAEDLGKPANIIYSRADATNDELVKTCTDMYIVQHVRDKITDENGVEELFSRAALASLYEEGNCKEFSCVAFKNAMEEFPEENVTIRRKRGVDIDHGWNDITIEFNKGKKRSEEMDISLDAWSQMRTPILTEDINQDYKRTKVLATVKKNKMQRLDEYYEMADKLHYKNPDPLREKENVARDGERKYRLALQQSLNAKGEMMIGTHTPDESLILSDDFDRKTEAKERKVANKLNEIFAQQNRSVNEDLVNSHIELLHQIRSSSMAKRIVMSQREAIDQANTSFSQRIEQESKSYQAIAR